MKCPICLIEYTEHSAISRWDNKTDICPKYGVREALLSFSEIPVIKNWHLWRSIVANLQVHKEVVDDGTKETKTQRRSKKVHSGAKRKNKKK